MKIVVLVKEVPDTYGDRTLDLETGLADRDASERVLDEIGERALEVALSYADAHHGTEVVVLSMAGEPATATVRKGLALGAGSAVQIVDERLRGADLGLTAQVLATAARQTGFDLIVAGDTSTDGSGGVVPAMVAELLGIPHATNLDSVRITESEVSGERATDGGVMSVSATLPAVVSVTDRLPDARFPNFKGIMAAKKKPLDVRTLDDLEVDVDDDAVSRSIMTAIAQRPSRAAGLKIVDEGDAGTRLAAFLADRGLV